MIGSAIMSHIPRMISMFPAPERKREMRPDFFRDKLVTLNDPASHVPEEFVVIGSDAIRAILVRAGEVADLSDDIAGFAWFDYIKKTWLVTMDYSFIGEYADWDEALKNLAVAYFKSAQVSP